MRYQSDRTGKGASPWVNRAWSNRALRGACNSDVRCAAWDCPPRSGRGPSSSCSRTITRSPYKIPQTTVPKAKHPAIDMHAHIYAKTPEQVDKWVRMMDEAGIQKAVVLTMATGKKFN